MTSSKTQHLTVLQPHPGIYAYYDGRVSGYRFMEEKNWVDDGAIALGIATYTVVEGKQAFVYDTHVSPEHGAFIREHLNGLGVTDVTVIYSHWHLDHVAGTSAFNDCDVIANEKTFHHLNARKTVIETGQYHGPPAVNPLILPTQTFSGTMELTLGDRRVVLIEANIHSDDATVLWLPEDGILLAGDTIEDPLTYVDEPADFAHHLRDLNHLAALEPRHILPDHGAPEIIAQGGFGPEVIKAMKRYIQWLMSLETAPEQARDRPEDILAVDIEAGTLKWFEPYRDVHAANVAAVLKLYGHA
ncbi:MBL fold metallo-hydrolase [Roseovarius sp. EL26]|uniref:MBL fold metallo-hydrolase n=1 Tax=Roseovarius sp. EL26 TaxID=2126672 RepID=UPI000EA2212E|nr:MBL fold metallo-hydrolase [Roseovarius sp. EL26]